MKRLRVRVFPFLFLFLFFVLPTGHAATITVDTLDDSVSSGDGCGLREAIDNANAQGAQPNTDCAASTAGTNDIAFDPGVVGTSVLSNGQIVVSSPVNINGPGPDVLTIDANGDDRVFDFNTTDTSSLSGILLTKGVRSNEGGAINVDSATLNLSNCVLQDNAADDDGGAITVESSGTLNMDNCVVSGNATSDDGGGINIHSSGTATITASTISGNIAESSAGGIDNSGDLTINNSTISGNFAVGDNGGGIRNHNGGSLTITNSTISGNSTGDDDGGGIYNTGGATLDVTNSTISGNTAEDGGGGVEVDDGTATFTHVTFTANMANNNQSGTNTGGGIHIQDGDVEIINTIIAGNLQTDGFLISNDCHLAFSGSGSLTATGKNLIQDPDCGDFDPTVDPNVITDVPGDLNALADNGGVVLPHTFTNALRIVSAAIDAADPAFCEATDQRGVARTAATCDIGAFELNAGMVQFSVADYTVNENGATATISVTRLGGSDGAISVDFATSDGTAVDGVDYTAASGTLNWDANDTSDKTFDVPIIDDGLIEGSETVILTLSNPQGGATLGAPNPATLTILDNDTPIPPGPPSRIINGGGCSLGGATSSSASSALALLPLLFAGGLFVFRKRVR